MHQLIQYYPSNTAARMSNDTVSHPSNTVARMPNDTVSHPTNTAARMSNDTVTSNQHSCKNIKWHSITSQQHSCKNVKWHSVTSQQHSCKNAKLHSVTSQQHSCKNHKSCIFLFDIWGVNDTFQDSVNCFYVSFLCFPTNVLYAYALSFLQYTWPYLLTLYYKITNTTVGELRFWHQCCWWFKSSGMCYRVGRMFPNVLRDGMFLWTAWPSKMKALCSFGTW